jgi:Glycosyltransferase family 87
MRSNLKVKDSHMYIKRLIEAQTCMWVFVVAGILVHGYLGQTWSEVQVFRVNDGWCETGREGVGSHCFGDFGLAFSGGTQSRIYAEGNPAAMNTPLTALLFSALRWLPYNHALFVYLGVLVASLITPFLFWSRSNQLGLRLQAAIFFGLISTGGIAAIDRGNHVVVVVPLLFAYLVSIEKSKWKLATFLLVAISLLKFWGIVLVVVLVAKARYKDAFWAIFLTPLITILLLIPHGGSLWESLHAMISAVVNREYGNAVVRYAFSVQGLVRRVACFAGSDKPCFPPEHADEWVASTLFSVLVLLFLMVFVFVVTRRSKDSPHVWMLFASSICFLGVPEAPVYQLALVTAAIAAIMATTNYGMKESWKWTSRMLFVSVVLTCTPVTLYSNQPIRLSSAATDSPHLFRSDQWLIPTSWLLAIIVGIIELRPIVNGQNRRHLHSALN